MELKNFESTNLSWDAPGPYSKYTKMNVGNGAIPTRRSYAAWVSENFQDAPDEVITAMYNYWYQI